MASQRFLNFTQSGLLRTGFGKIIGLIVNSHTSGTVKFVDGTEGAAVVATSDITSSGACAPASHATNRITSTGALVPGTHPTSVMTGNAIVATNTVTIGTTVYTFVAALTTTSAVAYEVLVGATLTATLLNLKNAINANSATKGVTYSFGTVAHPSVVATASDATTVTVFGRVPGTSLNTVVTTGTTTRISWADTTLGGGTGASDAGVTTAAATITIGTVVYTIVDILSETLGAAAIANQLFYGASVAATLDNLKAAINGSGTAGTEYSTGTVAHTQVVATTNSDTVQIIRGRVPGSSLDSVVTTETLANTSWADTTLGGGTGTSDPGVTTAAATITINGRVYTAVVELSESLGAAAIADQILWVTSEAVFLDNLKLAINGSGTAGTDYSTGTTPNIDVVATVNTNTVQTIVARKLGTVGNAITTSTTLANYAWTSTVLASGSGATGKLICNTITLEAVITVGDRFIPFFGGSYDTALSVVVGGTLDATLVIE